MPNSSLTKAECLELVRGEIRAVLSRRSSSLSEPAQPYQQLSEDLGLGSSEIVELVAALERRLALSSSESLPLTDFKTVDDVCRSCLASRPGLEGIPDAALAASLRRGEARRLRR